MIQTKTISKWILGPAIVLAVGHTVINKINMNKETAKTEVLPDITNALEIQNQEAATVFKVQQNLLNKFKNEKATPSDIDERIKVFEQKESLNVQQIPNK